MFKYVSFAALFFLVACSSSEPHVIQSSAANPELTVTPGLATQIEMPDAMRIQSVTVGNPALLSAEHEGNIVNVTAKEGTGETNIIIRTRDDDGHTKVFQYHVTVQAH